MDNSDNITLMIRDNQRGSVLLFVTLGLFVVLFLVAAVFGIWAYSSRQDYKDHSDQKAAAAIGVAIKQEDSKKDAEFVEAEKNPLRSYVGPETFGKLTIQYPKTWSAQVSENGGSAVIDGYMHPNFVPGLNSNTNFALRVQVLQTNYATALKQFDPLVKAGKSRVSPYEAPKVPGVVGTRIEGQVDANKSGIEVLLPLRDKTIKLWTESTPFFNDFNNIILPNVTFVP